MKLNIFKTYLNIMAFFGDLVSRLTPHNPSPEEFENNSTIKKNPTESFEVLDSRALKFGNHYRALGILIGLLGIGVVFCAIAPVGLQLEEHGEHIFGKTKIALMIAMLLVVIIGRRSHIRLHWANARREAEKLRYAGLGEAIDALEKNKDSAEKLVINELHKILDGDYGQISYNKSKARIYQNVEHFSDALVWISFVAVFIGAIGHYIAPEPLWIFLTAFFPAAVGALHGINGFLGISTLSEEHEMMTKHLTEASISLEQLERTNDLEQLHELAIGTLNILNTRDAQWAGTVRKVEGLKVHA